jgi:hypothetical protein
MLCTARPSADRHRRAARATRFSGEARNAIVAATVAELGPGIEIGLGHSRVDWPGVSIIEGATALTSTLARHFLGQTLPSWRRRRGLSSSCTALARALARFDARKRSATLTMRPPRRAFA